MDTPVGTLRGLYTPACMGFKSLEMVIPWLQWGFDMMDRGIEVSRSSNQQGLRGYDGAFKPFSPNYQDERD